MACRIRWYSPTRMRPRFTKQQRPASDPTRNWHYSFIRVEVLRSSTCYSHVSSSVTFPVRPTKLQCKWLLYCWPFLSPDCLFSWQWCTCKVDQNRKGVGPCVEQASALPRMLALTGVKCIPHPESRRRMMNCGSELSGESFIFRHCI